MKKHRANSILCWIILFFITLCGFLLLFFGVIQTSLAYRIIFLLVFLCSLIKLFFEITHTIYICDFGIESCHYGKVQRRLIWNDVSQICTMKPLPISMTVSAPSYILIIPKGCVEYIRERDIGYLYLFRNRHCVYKIDDTIVNRQLLKQYYGELDIQS